MSNTKGWTAEAREKQRNKYLNKTYESMYGKEKAKEMRKKNSESHKHPHTAEHNKHVHEAMQKRKKELGYIHTQETRAIMSKSHLDKHEKHTEEHNKKIGLAVSGINHPMYNKKHKEDSKRKQSCKKLGIELKDWKGYSIRNGYDSDFNDLFRRRIRKRDNYICMSCNIHQEKLNYALCIHHINYDKKCSIFQNCISLCGPCHARTNSNHPHWIKFFQSLLREKYGYQYAEDGTIKLNLDLFNVVK